MKIKLTADRRNTFEHELWRIIAGDEITRQEVIRRLSEFGPPQMETPFYYNGQLLWGFLTTFQIAEGLAIDRASGGYDFIAFHRVRGRPSWSAWEEGKGTGKNSMTERVNPSHWKNKFSAMGGFSRKK